MKNNSMDNKNRNYKIMGVNIDRTDRDVYIIFMTLTVLITPLVLDLFRKSN